MTLLVRDEEDVLESHLDYHLAQGVEFVVALDNGSSDDTVDVLRAYETKGVLRLLPTRTGAYRQGPWVSEMARLAALEHDADWIINNDADEFWWPTRGTLVDVLSAVPETYRQLRVPRNDFHPVGEAVAPDDPFWRRQTIRDVASVSPRGFRLVPKIAHRAGREVQVAYGNHALVGDGGLVAPPVGSLEILHFPVRTFRQFETKTRNLAEFSRADPERPPGALDDQIILDDLRRGGELRAYYDSLVLGSRAEAGPGVVADDRLAHFFEEGVDRRCSDPVAVALLRERYVEAEDWAAERQAALEAQVIRATAAEADLRNELGALRSAYDATDAALVEERQQHLQTAEALRLLRRSKAVRLSRRIRRLLPS